MPGVTGIIRKQPTGNETRESHLILQCMMNEPFYITNTSIEDEHGFYAGGVAIEGSFSDCMPIYNEKKDLVLLFSGNTLLRRRLLIISGLKDTSSILMVSAS